MSANTNLPNDSWDMVIRPKTGWFDIDFAGLWHYRDLVWLFVKRDFVTFYKQTILGPLWYVIQPLMTTVVFTIIFGNFAGIPTDDLPPFLFFLSGNVVWGYFSNTLRQTSDTFNANVAIFGKVYFPRLTVPAAISIVNFAQLFIQFVLFLGFYFYFYFKGAPIQPNLWILALPLLFLQMAILTFGIGILLSSLTTKYKDLRFAMTFVIQLWMYATPIVYPLSEVPDQYRLAYVLNPMVAIVESFRYALLGSGVIRMDYVLISVSVTFFFLILGLILFSRIEKTFMDTV